MMEVSFYCRFCGQLDKDNHHRECHVGTTAPDLAWEIHCKNCHDVAARAVQHAMTSLEVDMEPVRQCAIPSDFKDRQTIKLDPDGKSWRDYDWCEDLRFALTGCTKIDYCACTADGVHVAWSTHGVLAWHPNHAVYKTRPHPFVQLGGAPYGTVNLALFQFRKVKDFALSPAERKWLNNCKVPLTPKDTVTGVRFVTYNDSPFMHKDGREECSPKTHKGSIVVHTIEGKPSRNGNACGAWPQRIGEHLPKRTTCNDGWRLAFALAEKHGWRIVP